MSKVLDIVDNLPQHGLAQTNNINDAFTTTANKNYLFFGSLTFNQLLTVSANSEVVLLKPDVDFKDGFDVIGTLNWIS